jgi:hypothetical protein
VGGMPPVPDIQSYAPMFGIEFVRHFQFILHDETHRWRPDALVETQLPNSLMRDSSYVLRLNDIWYGVRKVPEMMRQRTRVAKIAGWPLVDCDNASSTNLEQWWSYMQQQPSIGIPALYFVYKTETTLEEVPESDWRQLAEIWTAFTVWSLQDGKLLFPVWRRQQIFRSASAPANSNRGLEDCFYRKQAGYLIIGNRRQAHRGDAAA